MPFLFDLLRYFSGPLLPAAEFLGTPGRIQALPLHP